MNSFEVLTKEKIMKSDLEINKQLALAIGWKEDDFVYGCDTEGKLDICIGEDSNEDQIWCMFDYRDWNVIGPIAAKYDCFPYKSYDCNGFCWGADIDMKYEYEDTPQKAIAMAVINLSRK